MTCSRLTRAQQEELGDPMIRSNVGVDGAATED
jgi:hypothetical protein